MRNAPLASLLLVAAFVGCGGDDKETTTPADVTIEVVNNKYVPADVTIKPGQTVEWVFKQGLHDVVAGSKTTVCTPNGQFKSELLSSGSFRHTFETAGDYPYFCTPHCGENMLGAVHVK